MRLAASAPGKVNLSLFVGGLRDDGRHELVTLLESVSLADELELVLAPEHERDVVECAGVEGPNLAADALAELRSLGWSAPPVRLTIAKCIPIAGGMAGGSADAAAALRLARAVAPLPEGIALERVAARLGSDVPSQLEPGLWLGTGAGELVAPVEPLAAHAFVIVPLAPALSSAAVYREADRLGLPRNSEDLARCAERLADALGPGASGPHGVFVNDLQPAAISLCPEISGALTAVAETGADVVLVSGSGPTVAGLFWGDGSAARAAADRLLERFPATVVATPVEAEFAAARRVG